MNRMHVEKEAKFLWTELTPPDDPVGDCLRAAGAEVGPPQLRDQTDTYLDTPDRRLMKSGWAFRCRSVEDKNTLGLKSVGKRDGAVQSRTELEQPVSEKPSGGLADLPSGAVTEQLGTLIKKTKVPFKALIEIETRRTAHRIEFGKLVAELVFDQASMNSKSHGVLRYTEIEFEFESGPETEFLTLVEKLESVPGLLPARMSKFQRGIHFAFYETCKSPRPIARSIAKPKENFARYVAEFLSQQFDLAFGFEDLAWEGVNPRGVHQMRVATRRFRSALSACDFALPPEAKEIGRALKELAAVLGRVRDLDVFLPKLRDHIGRLSDSTSAELKALETHVTSDWMDARRELAAFLSGPEFQKIKSSVPEFIAHCQSEKHCDTIPFTCRKAAQKLLPKRLDRVRAIGGSTDPKQASDDDLHQLRIKAKRFRYLVNLFAPVFGKPLANLANETSRVQDLLGAHQDACFELVAINNFAASAPPSDTLASALSEIAKGANKKRKSRRSAFPRFWERFFNSSDPKALLAALK